MLKIPDRYLGEIEIMGIKGREIDIPSRSDSDKNFLFVGGHHSSLEKLYPIADYLADYGNVHMPDIPGFGGMPSFRTIGRKIDIDSYADFLYEYIINKDLKNIWLNPNSIATLYITRMLQKYPELHPRIAKATALVGLIHKRDFNMPAWKFWSITVIAWIAQFYTISRIIHWIAFNPVSIKILLYVIRKNHSKFKTATDETIDQFMDTERKLWLTNDHQTHAKSTLFMFWADLEYEGQEKLPFTMYNITANADQYFDQDRMAQSMNNLYTGYKRLVLDLDVHAPADLGTKESIAEMMTPEIEELLKS